MLGYEYFKYCVSSPNVLVLAIMNNFGREFVEMEYCVNHSHPSSLEILPNILVIVSFKKKEQKESKYNDLKKK